MSAKLVKQTMALLNADAADNRPQAKSSNATANNKASQAATGVKKTVERASKHGIKRQRDLMRARCTEGQQQRKEQLYKSADPLNEIRNAEAKQSEQLRQNLAYLAKTSQVSRREKRARRRVMAHLNVEVAAQQALRNKKRRIMKRIANAASDDEWAALDV